MIKICFRRSGSLLFFILSVIVLTSCATLHNIPSSQLTFMPRGKNIYYFHSEDSVVLVYPVPAENGLFSGIIVDSPSIQNNKLREIHIYAGPSSAIKIENHKLTCPVENIGKVENHRIKAGTIISSIGALLLLFTVPIFL